MTSLRTGTLNDPIPRSAVRSAAHVPAPIATRPVMATRRLNHTWRLAGAVFACVMLSAPLVRAHFSVIEPDRVGVPPEAPGIGWLAEVYLDLPPSAADNLLAAEAHVRENAPDLTFRTSYIDFPAGPVAARLDTSFDTFGAFIEGADVSEVVPAELLDTPFGDFVICFSGYVDVRLAHSTLGIAGLPVLLDFATFAHGGYRTRVGATSIYRVQDTQFLSGPPLFTENALVLAAGLFPIRVTYLQRFDPGDAEDNALAGIELYSFHPGGLPWPAGAAIVDPVFGSMTVMPPSVVYQPEQRPPLPLGDADGDHAVSLRDMQVFQQCAGVSGVTGESVTPQCAVFDFDGDDAVDASDLEIMTAMLRGPRQAAFLPGDYVADHAINLADVAWLQTCVTGGDDESVEAALATGCDSFDTDRDGDVDLVDYERVHRLLERLSGL